MPAENSAAERTATIAHNVTEDKFELKSPDKPDLPEKLDSWKETKEALERSSMLYEFESIWQAFQGESIKVAILDSGIDIDHPAFPAEALHTCARVQSGVVTYGREAVRDYNGHGTHCAGLVAARPLGWDKANNKYVPYEPNLLVTRGSNIENIDKLRADRRSVIWSTKDSGQRAFEDLDIPFSGVAPRAKLMIYKVTRDELDKEGNVRRDSNGDPIDLGIADIDDLAKAIVLAVKDGADIISISIQSETGTDTLFSAVHRALWRRRIVICSAGNRGRRQPINVGYPGRYGGVITVGAVSRYGQPASFTSIGGEVDVGAPGENVWSTWKGNSYHEQSGTSMAAPWVAGIAALVLSKHRDFALDPTRGNNTPIRNNEEMREHILTMAAHPGHYDSATGYGALWPGDYFARGSALQ